MIITESMRAINISLYGPPNHYDELPVIWKRGNIKEHGNTNWKVKGKSYKEKSYSIKGVEA